MYNMYAYQVFAKDKTTNEAFFTSYLLAYIVHCNPLDRQQKAYSGLRREMQSESGTGISLFHWEMGNGWLLVTQPVVGYCSHGLG